MKRYIGKCTPNEMNWSAYVEDDSSKALRPLNPRLDISNHSPTGFAWGYGGSGPAQLALALLADALGDDERAAKLHQDFKWRVVGRWDKDSDWTITEADVIRIVGEIEQKKEQRKMVDQENVADLLAGMKNLWAKSTEENGQSPDRCFEVMMASAALIASVIESSPNPREIADWYQDALAKCRMEVKDNLLAPRQ